MVAAARLTSQSYASNTTRAIGVPPCQCHPLPDGFGPRAGEGIYAASLVPQRSDLELYASNAARAF
jgi:hypothetical protein